MLFVLIARGCDDFAVALITADSLKAAVETVVPKFGRAPTSVKIGDSSARIEFEDFLYGDDCADVMDLGDCGGDIAMAYIVRPVPVAPYVKIGCFVN